MARNVKVGIFLLLGLIVAGVLIFLVGDERHMFQRHTVLNATFHDVAGLKVGSPVRMGGLDVGQVEAITFGASNSDRLIHVRFSMIGEQLQRVRTDSRVSIASKGLLGDKALDVTMGTAAGGAVPSGGTVVSEESDDMAGALHAASQAVTRVNSVLENVSHITSTLGSPQTMNDIQAALHDVSTMTHQIAVGPGAAHDVLTNPEMARNLDLTLNSLQQTAAHASQTMASVDQLLRDARNGNGLVHALVYDRAGGTMVANLGTAAQEVGNIVRDVRTGNGGLHQVIYGTDLSQTLANVNQLTTQTNALMTDIRAGRGTIGALLVDPSLYEDIKTLVGNVQRNEVLRALVRYSIHQDEAPQPVVGASPAPTAAANQRTVARPVAARPAPRALAPRAPVSRPAMAP